MIIKVDPVIDTSVRGLCVKQYPGHPRGCPNFNHKEGCPPQAKLFADVFNLKYPVYAIVNVFEFGKHCTRMKLIHPEWSKRQVECCLYWQPTARKQLETEIQNFKSAKGLRVDGSPRYVVTRCPEAMGVDITKTLHNAGIDLEWPPVNVTYQVALAGVRKK